MPLALQEIKQYPNFYTFLHEKVNNKIDNCYKLHESTLPNRIEKYESVFKQLEAKILGS